MSTYLFTSFAEPALTGGAPGSVIKRVATKEVIAPVNADIYKVFKLPVNAKILDGGIISDALDAHATPTGTLELQVTDGTTTKKLLDGVVTSGTYNAVSAMAAANLPGSFTGEVTPFTWFNFVTNNQDYEVRVVADAAYATGAAGTLTAWIEYTMDLEGGESN